MAALSFTVQIGFGPGSGPAAENFHENFLGLVGLQVGGLQPFIAAEPLDAGRFFVDQPLQGQTPEPVRTDTAGHHVDMAVQAFVDAGAGETLPTGIALADRAFEVVELDRVFHCQHHAFLHRHIDMLALAAGLGLSQRQHRGDCAEHAGSRDRLVAESADRR